MSHPEEYDVVVLGSGRARFFAWSLASQGKRVAVVERRNLAGSCPTIACAPSKNVIHGAKVANYFRRGAEFGIAAGDWKVEMPAVRDRKRKMVDGIVARNVNSYRESGAELVKGQGRFVGPRTIEVTADDGTRTLRGEVVVICTGSRARIDPIPGLAESRPMTHIEALELDRVPKHLLVLGGGYVGLEMAQALRRFGSRVTVIESLFQKGGLERRKGMNPKPYPSDLTSQQWAVLKPFLPPARTGGRPRKTEMRSVVNAIFYRNRNGCIWRALPHDFPPWRTVYNYFAAWKRDGTWKVDDARRPRPQAEDGRWHCRS